jgi:hypothetical protein
VGADGVGSAVPGPARRGVGPRPHGRARHRNTPEPHMHTGHSVTGFAGRPRGCRARRGHARFRRDCQVGAPEGRPLRDRSARSRT